MEIISWETPFLMLSYLKTKYFTQKFSQSLDHSRVLQFCYTKLQKNIYQFYFLILNTLNNLLKVKNAL